MFCPKCGAKIVADAMFCNICGAKLNEAARPQTEGNAVKKRKKSHAGLWGFLSGLSLMVLITAILLLCGVMGEKEYEVGFSSPEDAAMAYLEGLRDADVEKMLSSFAAETNCQGYYLTMYEKGPYKLSYNQHLLEPCVPMAEIYQYADPSKYILQTYLTLTQEPKDVFALDFSAYGMEAFDSMIMTRRSNFSHYPEDLEEYADILRDEEWLEQLSEMEIGDVLDAEDFLSTSKREYRAALERGAELLGADDVQTVVIEVTIGDYDLYYVMDTFCVDGMWYNCGCRFSGLLDLDGNDNYLDLFVMRDT